jgi:hypothetical protein
MRMMEHLSRGREIRSAYRISVATSVGKGSYVVSIIDWCNIIKSDMSGIICIGIEVQCGPG